MQSGRQVGTFQRNLLSPSSVQSVDIARGGSISRTNILYTVLTPGLARTQVALAANSPTLEMEAASSAGISVYQMT
jgi:hypothetical protein